MANCNPMGQQYSPNPTLEKERLLRRIKTLEDTVGTLEDAIRGLLKHCNPDIPPGPNLWKARERALQSIRQLYDR